MVKLSQNELMEANGTSGGMSGKVKWLCDNVHNTSSLFSIRPIWARLLSFIHDAGSSVLVTELAAAATFGWLAVIHCPEHCQVGTWTVSVNPEIAS